MLIIYNVFNFFFVGGGSLFIVDFVVYKLRLFYIFLLCCSLLWIKIVMDVRRMKRVLVVILEWKGK